MTDEAFAIGYENYKAGKGFLDNPYPDGTVEARRYVDGFVQAMQDRRQLKAGEI